MVARLAEAKARAAVARVSRSQTDCIVIGADTAVELGGEIFGKPRDAADAREMLAALSGRTHRVLTGIFLIRLPDDVTRSAVESTSVALLALEREEIEAYVATGEPLDKAGAYAIQGLASKFVERIEGDYFNVMGLPVALVYRKLRQGLRFGCT